MKFLNLFLSMILCLMPTLAQASLACNGSNVVYSSGTTNLTGMTNNTLSIGGWFSFNGINFTASRIFEFESETGADDQVINLGMQDCTAYGGTVNTLCISVGFDNTANNLFGGVYIATSLPVTGKHHIIVTWNNLSGTVATDFVFYIDGVATGTPTGLFSGSSYGAGTILSGLRSSTSVFFGAGADGFVTHDYFPGTMSDLALWNKALTAAEVTTLYNGGNPAPCLRIPASIESSSLVAYFPLDDNPSGIVSTNVTEYSGNYSFTVNTNVGNVTWSNDMSCAYNHTNKVSNGTVSVLGRSLL